MKIIILIFLSTLFFSQIALAESVKCASDDGVWKITLELSDVAANDMKFYKNDQLIKTFESDLGIDVTVVRFMKAKFYDIALGGSKYLNITRPLVGKIPGNEAIADFLLTNNPFGWEQHADCKIQ